MAEPPRGGEIEQPTALVGEGETLSSNDVFNTFAAAQQAMGEGFNAKQVLSYTKFDMLSAKEKAWVQRRLRRELKVTLPESKQVDERILAKSGGKSETKSEAPKPAPQAEPEVSLEERVRGLATLIQRDFERARDRGQAFSREVFLQRYKGSLGDEGVRLLAQELDRLGVKDLKEGAGEEGVPEAGAVPAGRPPEPESRPARQEITYIIKPDRDGKPAVFSVVQTEGEEPKEYWQGRSVSIPEGIVGTPREQEFLALVNEIEMTFGRRIDYDQKKIFLRCIVQGEEKKVTFDVPDEFHDVLPLWREKKKIEDMTPEQAQKFKNFKYWYYASLKYDAMNYFTNEIFGKPAEGPAPAPPPSTPEVVPAVPPAAPPPAEAPPTVPPAIETPPTAVPAVPPAEVRLPPLPTEEPLAAAEVEPMQFINKAKVAFWKLQQAQLELQRAKEEFEKFDIWFNRNFRGGERGGEHARLQVQYENKQEDLGRTQDSYESKLDEAANVAGRDIAELKNEIETRKVEGGAEGRAAGIVAPPPERREGETEEQYLTRWERWKDAVKSFPAGVGRMVWNVGSTLIGLKLVQTTYEYFEEKSKLKKAGGELAEMVKVLEEARLRVVPTAEAEINRRAEALKARIAQMGRDGRLKPVEEKLLYKQIEKALEKRAGAEAGARQDLSQEVSQILSDYFKRKVTGGEVARQALNTGLLLSGLQFARSLSYAGLTALRRAAAARKNYEYQIEAARLEPGGEGREVKFWERESAILKDITGQAAEDYLKGISGAFVDLFSGKRVSKGDWARKKMEFSKALGSTMVFAGLAGVTYAEISESGFSPSAQIDRVLDSIEQHGIGATIGNNFVHNIEQLSFGLIRFGDDAAGGAVAVAAHPDHGFARPAEAGVVAEVRPLEKSPEELAQEAETKFFEAHPEYQRLEHEGLVDVQGQPDGQVRMEINLGVKEGGYRYVQQAFRDLTVQELKLEGDKFTTLDAAHTENIVANLKHLSMGRDFSFMKAEELDGAVHLAAGKLVIDDYDKFHEVLEKLAVHAGEKITEGNLGAHSELVATVNNTSDAHWQHDVDMKTGVSAPAETGYVKVDLDHQFIHQAEIQTAQHLTDDLGIADAQVDTDSVVNEYNFEITIGDRAVAVVDGQMMEITTTVGDYNYKSDALEWPIDVKDATAGHYLGQVLELHDRAVAEAVVDTKWNEIVPNADAAIWFGRLSVGAQFLRDTQENTPTEFVNLFKTGGSIIDQNLEHWGKPGPIHVMADYINTHPDAGSATMKEYIVKHLDELKTLQAIQAAK